MSLELEFICGRAECTELRHSTDVRQHLVGKAQESSRLKIESNFS